MVALSLILHFMVAGIVAISMKRKYPLYVPKAISVKIISKYRKPRSESMGPADVSKKGIEQAEKAKPDTDKVSKEDMQVLEDRMQLLKAKKRVRDIKKLRSIIDISTRNIKQEMERGAGGEDAQTDEESVPEGAASEGILGAYIDQISAQIRREWVFPGVFGTEGLETIIDVRIDREGNIEVIGIEKKSQNGLFDRSVMRAITKASPVKRPPYEMEFGFRFRP